MGKGRRRAQTSRRADAMGLTAHRQAGARLADYLGA
jgi:hypothetical protein